ncbi:hypothetical protein IFM89_004326 [Coptis chinensis]|uniref:DUF4283 domain-containing protein n=1 Tax=Coptis chinensis TaxID=261450 RepID=A0A835LZ47_9MAGN|nr:hypothetical protein IFM89_004326 [Coptis chinensis]
MEMLREKPIEDRGDMPEHERQDRARIEQLQVEMGNLFCAKENRVVEITSSNKEDNTDEQCTLMGKMMEFEDKEELDHVLSNGPWFIQGFIFLIKKGIHTDEVALTKMFDLVDFWIQIYGIPRDRITEENVRNVGALLGKVKAVDLCCQREFRTPVARIRVRMDIKERLVKGVDLIIEKGEVIPITFKYEKLEIFYYFCGCIGHDIHYCNKRGNYNIELCKHGGSPRDIKNNFSFTMRANVFFNGEASMGPISVTISGTPRKPRADQIPAKPRSSPGIRRWYGAGVLTSPIIDGTVGRDSVYRDKRLEVREQEVREVRTASLDAEVEGSVTVGGTYSNYGGLMDLAVDQGQGEVIQAQEEDITGLSPMQVNGPDTHRGTVVVWSPKEGNNNNSSGYNGDGSSEEEKSGKEARSKGKIAGVGIVVLVNCSVHKHDMNRQIKDRLGDSFSRVPFATLMYGGNGGGGNDGGGDGGGGSGGGGGSRWWPGKCKTFGHSDTKCNKNKQQVWRQRVLVVNSVAATNVNVPNFQTRQTSTLRNEIGVETTTSSPCLEIELFKEAPTNGVGSIWENTIVIKDSTTEQEHPVVITEQGPIVVYQAQSGTITDKVSVPVLIESVVEDLQGRKYIQDKDNHSLIDEDFDTCDESNRIIAAETDNFSDDQGVEEGLVVVTKVTPPREDSAGIGGAIRDHAGEVLLAFNGSNSGKCIFTQELLAIRTGLEGCIMKGFKKVVVASDSLHAVKCINKIEAPLVLPQSCFEHSMLVSSF